MILNRYEKMVAKRYLLPGKGEGFIFVVAGFSVGAVALGVAALINVMSVMNGFRAELFDKVVGLNGHAIIQGYDGRLTNWQQIAAADDIYAKLKAAGIETLYDDRDERGGVKLGTMDLIGLPWQLIIGPRGLAQGLVELKNRATGEKQELSIESALERLTA